MGVGETGECDADFRALAFGLERSVRYHDCRADFLRDASRCCSFFTVLAGAGTTLAVFRQWSDWLQQTLAVLVTAVSLGNLVFDLRGASDVHRKLSADFSLLLGELEVAPAKTPELLSNLRLRRRELENRSPAALKILDVCCHNDLVRAKGHEQGEFVDLCWWQRAFKHVASFGRIPPKRADKD